MLILVDIVKRLRSVRKQYRRALNIKGMGNSDYNYCMLIYQVILNVRVIQF